MLKLAQHMRSSCRLMVGLFTLQFFAAGFCLIAPAAHASDMPMASSMGSQASSSHASLNFDSACDQAAMGEFKHVDHEMAACAHCDLPNELVSNAVSNFNIDFPVVVLLTATIDLALPLTTDLSVSPATGPPESSPRRFHTNQRILI